MKEHSPAARPNPEARPAESPRPNQRLVTLADTAAMLSISLSTVRRLVWSGKLPATRLSRRVLVDVKDLDRLIERSKDRGFWQ